MNARGTDLSMIVLLVRFCIGKDDGSQWYGWIDTYGRVRNPPVRSIRRPYVQSDALSFNQPKDVEVLNRRMLCKNSRPEFFCGAWGTNLNAKFLELVTGLEVI